MNGNSPLADPTCFGACNPSFGKQGQNEQAWVASPKDFKAALAFKAWGSMTI